MPDLNPQVDTAALERLFVENWLAALVIGVGLIALWWLTPRLVVPTVRRGMAASAGEFAEGGVNALELAKRSRTIESLAIALIRITIVVALAVIVVGLLDLWGLLAAIGILLAAVTLAGQPIVLDFLMGIAIVVEGTFFEGDSISAGDPQWKIGGTVETLGLRHTVVRSPDGTVHSISNRDLAQVSNRTRIFAGADVTVRGVRDEDFERAIEVMDSVGRDVAADPAFGDIVIEPLSVQVVGDPDDLGWTVTMRGRVVAGQRWIVATEVRKRLVPALRDNGILLNRRAVPATGHRDLRPEAAVDASAGDDDASGKG